MFDYIKKVDDEIEFNVPTVCFVVGWLPFIIAWGEYNTAFTEFLVQAYFLTIFLFVVYPRKYERRNVRRLWFWKAILVVAFPLHPAILAAMWLFDVWTKTQWHAARTVTTIIILASMIEVPLVQKIVNFFRPANDTSLKGGDRAVKP
jgi:hypothetical protein